MNKSLYPRPDAHAQAARAVALQRCAGHAGAGHARSRAPWWVITVMFCAVALAWVQTAWAESAATVDSAVPPALASQVQHMAQTAAQASQSGQGVRIDITVGKLDARLKLAPCDQVEPYLPSGVRLWGRSHIGLRCLRGPTRWNVYLPITVHVFAKALVADVALPTGTVIEASHLREAEVDLAQDPAPAVRQLAQAQGRTLAQALDAGQTLRTTALKSRQWFAAGDSVRVIAKGPGYSVAGEGVALSMGLEGQTVRIRTETGTVLTGIAVADHRVEVNL